MCSKARKEFRETIPFNIKHPMMLLHACRMGDIHVIKSLMKNHVCHIDYCSDLLDWDILSIRDFHGAGVFHYAARGDHVSVLQFFLPFLKNRPFPRTSAFSTPAHDAAALGNLKSLKWLLKHDRQQLREKDIDGCNILHLAAR